MTAPGLHCCAWAFSSCNEQGLLFSCGACISHCSGFCCRVQVLHIWASVLPVHGVSSCFSSNSSWALDCGLSSCGAQAQLLHGMWNLSRPGTELMSPTLAGGFFFFFLLFFWACSFLSSVPPGKSYKSFLICLFLISVFVSLILKFCYWCIYIWCFNVFS